MASAWGKARAGGTPVVHRTSPEREDEAREEMLKELDRFTHERVSEGELKQAINYLSGQAEVSESSGSAIAGEIFEAWILGTGLHEMGNPAARFRAVTADTSSGPVPDSSIQPAGWRASCAARARAKRTPRLPAAGDHVPCPSRTAGDRAAIPRTEPLCRRRVEHDCPSRTTRPPRCYPIDAHGRWPVRRHAYGSSGGNNDRRKSRSVCQKAAGKRGQFESSVV